jgi:hypothetical protein
VGAWLGAAHGGRTAETGALLQQEETLREVHQLARVLDKMGEVDAARKLYEEVIEGRTAQLGGSHTSTLTTKASLGHMLMGEGKIAESKAIMEEVAAGFLEQRGASHPDTKMYQGAVAQLAAMLDASQ